MAKGTCSECGVCFEYPYRSNRIQKTCSVKCKGISKKTNISNSPRYDEFKIAANKYENSLLSAFEVSQSIGVSEKKFRAILKYFGVAAKSKGRPGISRSDNKPFIFCGHCGVKFRAPKSALRIYCSYQCHLDNGGAQKAGAFAAMAKSKYGYKKDANHDEIFEVMRAYVPVKDLSMMGCGMPDGLAWINKGWHLFDVKNPKTSYGRKGLNKLQKSWAQSWLGGPVYLIYSEEDATNFVKGRFDKIKRFPKDKMTPKEFHEIS
jgi:hypothetical protein